MTKKQLERALEMITSYVKSDLEFYKTFTIENQSEIHKAKCEGKREYIENLLKDIEAVKEAAKEY